MAGTADLRDQLKEKISRLIRNAQSAGDVEDLAQALILSFELGFDEAREPYADLDIDVALRSVIDAIEE